MCEHVQALMAGRRPRRCVVVAELGVNHDGNVARALALLEAARHAGADAAKLQFFTPAALCSRLHRAEERAMLESLRLSDEAHERIVAAARAMTLPVFATPFDDAGIELCRRLDVPVVKVGSGEVTHTPLLARVAALRRPVILSTGGAEWIDVERAASTLEVGGAPALSLLHCVSAYPPPDSELNLRVIPALAERYPQCTVGLSDHTLGSEAAVAAVALGARIVEKHLTLDRSAPGPDHVASADPAAFAHLVRAIRRTELMLGDGTKRVQPCEGVIGRSIVAARPLPAGHVLRPEDLAFKRPAGGLRPWAAGSLVGARLRRGVEPDDVIAEGDVDVAGTPSV